MPDFSGLPNELINLVLDEFASSADLGDIFRSRAVCRLFAKRLSYALVAQIPPSAFEDYSSTYRRQFDDGQPQHDPAPYVFWRENLATVLYHQLEDPCGATPEFLAFVHKVADVVQVGLGVDRSVILRDIAQAMAAINPDCVSHISGRKPKKASHLGHNNMAEALAYFAEQHPSKEDVLGAASAVGNNAIIINCLAQGVTASAQGIGFNNPIQAAASTGKTASLKILLDDELGRIDAIADRFSYLTAYGERARLFRLTVTAVYVATDNNHAQAAVMLIKFMRDHCADFLPQLNMDISARVAGYGNASLFSRHVNAPNRQLNLNFLARAAGYGNASLVELLMETDDLSKDFACVDDVKAAVHAALTAGDRVYGMGNGKSVVVPNSTAHQINVVRYFCDSGVITASPTAPYHCSMKKAMQLAPRSGSCTLLDFLIAQGATQEHVNFALEAAVAHWGEVTGRPIFDIVQHLLGCGAVVDEQLLDQCDRHASNIVRSVVGAQGFRINVTDGAKVSVLVSHQLMGQQTRHKLPFNVKVVLKRVVSGKIAMPTKPMQFVDMAKEVLEWL